jgi:hypothetical protein
MGNAAVPIACMYVLIRLAGTHGVVFLFDVTKKWTFDYVIESLSEVPPSIPVLILVQPSWVLYQSTEVMTSPTG